MRNDISLSDICDLLRSENIAFIATTCLCSERLQVTCTRVVLLGELLEGEQSRRADDFERKRQRDGAGTF